MGLEDGRIQDSQISVSTSISSNNNHRAVRLNLPNIPGLSGGGWRPDNDDKWPWVQVDFKQTVTVTGVITQGRKTGSPQYVKKYLVKYSDDGSRWHDTGKVCAYSSLTIPLHGLHRCFSESTSPGERKTSSALRFEAVTFKLYQFMIDT